MVYVNESKSVKDFKKESREIAENQIRNLTEKNPIQRSKLSNIIWNEHLKRIEIMKG